MIVFLIGFMGCGKSRTGRKLSKKMDIPLEDIDKVIEEKVGMSVADFFEKEGEESFRKLENDYLQNLDYNQNLIVSTGGGVPCFYNNMEIMRQKGVTIFLNSPIENILDRVKRRKEKRPLLKPLFEKDEVEFNAIIQERLNQRIPFYSQADIIVTENKVGKMVKLIKEFKKKKDKGEKVKPVGNENQPEKLKVKEKKEEKKEDKKKSKK